MDRENFTYISQRAFRSLYDNQPLMLCIEIIGVCCGNYTERINRVCEKKSRISLPYNRWCIELPLSFKWSISWFSYPEESTTRATCGKEGMVKNG
jgi:hypothetical protein